MPWPSGVPASRRAGRCLRSVQSRAHVRTKDEAFRGLRRGREVVPARRRAGHSPTHSSISGSCTAKARVFPRTIAEAANWFRRAAEQGDADRSCTISGSCTRMVKASPRTYTEAAKWTRRAARAGARSTLRFHLGFMYRRRRGVPQRLRRGGEVDYRRAAEQGLRPKLRTSRAHVRQRLRRSPGLRRSDDDGTVEPRSRATLALRTTSGSCTRTAPVFPRTSFKRTSGTTSPPPAPRRRIRTFARRPSVLVIGSRRG